MTNIINRLQKQIAQTNRIIQIMDRWNMETKTAFPDKNTLFDLRREFEDVGYTAFKTQMQFQNNREAIVYSFFPSHLITHHKNNLQILTANLESLQHG